MKIFKKLPAGPVLGKLSLAMGVFDGLHLGHQKVLKAALKGPGRAAVLTFEGLPERLLSPAYAPPALMGLDQRLEGFEKLGFKAAFVLKFNRALAALPAEEFARRLKKMGVVSASVGADFVFGAHAAGDAATLRSAGISVREASPAQYLGRPLSSTRLRHAIALGDVKAAAAMLGRPFKIRGRVVKGRQLGRTIGFPTANLTQQECLPKDGVYGVAVRVLPEKKLRPGLMNLGVRPTIGGIKRVLEIHLQGFDGKLYGKELEASLLVKLREERRFNSLEALTKQIRLDDVRFRRYWASYSGSRSSGADLG